MVWSWRIPQTFPEAKVVSTKKLWRQLLCLQTVLSITAFWKQFRVLLHRFNAIKLPTCILPYEKRVLPSLIDVFQFCSMKTHGYMSQYWRSEKLTDLEYETLPQPPYFLNFSSTDCHYFNLLSTPLNGETFRS